MEQVIQQLELDLDIDDIDLCLNETELWRRKLHWEEYIAPSPIEMDEVEQWVNSFEIDENPNYIHCQIDNCGSWNVLKDKCRCMRYSFKSYESKTRYMESLLENNLSRLLGTMINVPLEK